MRGIRHIALAACCAALLLAGCEEDVAGPTGIEEPFTVFGVLNPRLNTQELLVSPISASLAPSDAPIDAVVTSMDLETGEVHSWRPELEPNATGQLDHIYRSEFRPEFGGAYRIEITRSDGASTLIGVEVPGQVVVDTDEEGGVLDLRITGEEFRIVDASISFAVRFYDLNMSDREMCQPGNPLGTYTLPLANTPTKIDGGYRYRLSLDEVYEILRGYYAADYSPEHFDGFSNPNFDGLALMDIEASLTVGGLAWDPPGGNLDINARAFPSSLDDAQNGFGFVGGGYDQEIRIRPSKNLVGKTWFFDRLIRPGDSSEENVCVDFCSCGIGSAS